MSSCKPSGSSSGRGLLAAVVLVPSLAAAHPEEQFRPDSAAEMECRTETELFPTDARARTRLALVLLARFKLLDAEQELTAVLGRDPTSVTALSAMAQVRSIQGRADEAAAWIARAQAVPTEDPGALFQLGRALEANGRAAAAEDAYRKALAALQAPGAKVPPRLARDVQSSLVHLQSERAAAAPGR